jgi:integrase
MTESYAAIDGELLDGELDAPPKPAGRGLERSAGAGGAAAAWTAAVDRVADQLAAEALAANTRRAYEGDWRHFTAWCADPAGSGDPADAYPPLPAAPATVIRYLATHQGRHAVATLQRRLTTIAVVHHTAGLPDPTKDARVQRVVDGLKRRHGTRPGRRATPADVACLRAMLATCQPADNEPEPARRRAALGRCRDRALLLVGFAGYLRRSELAGMRLGHITETAKGLELLLPRSKADQEGQADPVRIPYHSDPELCPVRAWRGWLAVLTDHQAADDPAGVVWLEVTKGGRLVVGTDLSDRAISEIVKRRAARAGFDPSAFSGHSLRAGMATAAAEAQVPGYTIKRDGRWKSDAVDAYIRPADQWRNHSFSRIR